MRSDAAADAGMRNLLIGSLGDADRLLLAPHLERVELGEKELLAQAGAPMESACFIEAGIASFASVSPSGLQTGVAIVGREGLVGCHALLGCDVSPYEVTVAGGGGSALRISAANLAFACEQSATLRMLIMRFVQSFMAQLAQTAVSNLNDPVERRLSRWLLMNHDRRDGDEIELTHAEIGEMLGVRRASVTDALHLLEGRGLIRSRRRRITIRDRRGLREAAGENYGAAEAEYSRLIAPFGKDA